MKGRGNYACRQKIYDAEKEPVLEGLEEVADFQMIREWEKTTETGDRAEIKTLPGISYRMGQDRRAQRTLHRAEVPAVRALLHHADAPEGAGKRHHHRQPPPVLRRPGGEGRRWRGMGGIIPEYGAVIFDEAHDVEDVAGQYFGISVSSYQFEESGARRRCARAAQKFWIAGTGPHPHDARAIAPRNFFVLFGANEGRSGFRAHEAFLERTTICTRTYRRRLKSCAATGIVARRT